MTTLLARTSRYTTTGPIDRGTVLQYFARQPINASWCAKQANCAIYVHLCVCLCVRDTDFIRMLVYVLIAAHGKCWACCMYVWYP